MQQETPATSLKGDFWICLVTNLEEGRSISIAGQRAHPLRPQEGFWNRPGINHPLYNEARSQNLRGASVSEGMQSSRLTR